MKYLIFLDYDGTLTPIVKKPHLAKLTAKQKSFLKKLAANPEVILTIVSGRKLAEVKKLVGLPHIFYAGNHGFEIKGPALSKVHPKALASKPTLKKIKKALAAAAKKIKGALVEDKTYTLSLHYRLVKAKDLKKLEETFKEIIAPYLKGKNIRVTHGKKVFEVRPNIDWNKGLAVRWLISKLVKGKKHIPIYIGDDTTDEDAFKLLRKKGVTIRVGKFKETSAKNFLKDVNDVYKFLKILALEF